MRTECNLVAVGTNTSYVLCARHVTTSCPQSLGKSRSCSPFYQRTFPSLRCSFGDLLLAVASLRRDLNAPRVKSRLLSTIHIACVEPDRWLSNNEAVRQLHFGQVLADTKRIQHAPLPDLGRLPQCRPCLSETTEMGLYKSSGPS